MDKANEQRRVHNGQRHAKRKSVKAKGIPRRKQAHGGALLTGGVPGNRGGRGGPIRHGLYADLTKHPELRQLIDQFQASEQPLDTLPEVATIRAMIVHLFNRVQARRRVSLGMIMAAAKLLSEVTKAVKRIEDVRAQNAISREEFRRLLHGMAGVVRDAIEKHVSDAGQQERITAEIQAGWRVFAR
jgi:hypothetical protein